MTVYRCEIASLEPRNGNFSWRCSLCLPQALFLFLSLSLRRLIQSWCWQVPLKKNGADTRNQTLLELMTRPSEMCCVACRERTPWGWNKMEVIYQRRRGHKRKPGINTFSASDLKIEVCCYGSEQIQLFVLLIIEFKQAASVQRGRPHFHYMYSSLSVASVVLQNDLLWFEISFFGLSNCFLSNWLIPSFCAACLSTCVKVKASDSQNLTEIL